MNIVVLTLTTEHKRNGSVSGNAVIKVEKKIGKSFVSWSRRRSASNKEHSLEMEYKGPSDRENTGLNHRKCHNY